MCILVRRLAALFRFDTIECIRRWDGRTGRPERLRRQNVLFVNKALAMMRILNRRIQQIPDTEQRQQRLATVMSWARVDRVTDMYDFNYILENTVAWTSVLDAEQQALDNLALWMAEAFYMCYHVYALFDEVESLREQLHDNDDGKETDTINSLLANYSAALLNARGSFLCFPKDPDFIANVLKNFMTAFEARNTLRQAMQQVSVRALATMREFMPSSILLQLGLARLLHLEWPDTPDMDVAELIALGGVQEEFNAKYSN